MASRPAAAERPSDLLVRRRRRDDVGPGDLPPLTPDQDHPVWRRTVVAERAGSVLGVATAQLNPVTESYFVEVHVVAAHRRVGIGTELYGHLCSLLDASHPILTRAMASQPLRRQFAEAIGCEVQQHHPEPWADPTAPDWQHWIELHPVPAEHATVPLAELDPDVAERAWTEYHRWSRARVGPVRAERLGEAWRRMRDGLDDLASRVVVPVDHPDRPSALSLVASRTWQGRTMLVSETVREDQPEGTALVAAAVASSLRELGRRGVRLVELEGHSTDPHSPALVAGLPPHRSDPMDMLRLRRP